MVLWQHVVLCKGTLFRMRLTVGVRSVLRCDGLALSQRNTLERASRCIWAFGCVGCSAFKVADYY